MKTANSKIGRQARLTSKQLISKLENQELSMEERSQALLILEKRGVDITSFSNQMHGLKAAKIRALHAAGMETNAIVKQLQSDDVKVYYSEVHRITHPKTMAPA